CTSCHMPTSSSLDIPHVTITDHFIRVVEEVPEQDVEAQRAFLGIASLVDPDPSDLNVAQGYLAYFEQFDPQRQFLDSAAAYLERANGTTAEIETAVRLAFLQSDFERVKRLGQGTPMASVEDPWTLYRIGEAHLGTGSLSQARQFLEQTVRLAPVNLEFR